MNSIRRTAPIILLLLLLTGIGSVGFRVLSGAGWLDSAYMAVITLTTVGYSEAVPMTPAVKVFVIVYLMAGLSVFTYSAFQLGQTIVSLRLNPNAKKKRMKSSIEELEGHYIVCGFGRMGRKMCEYLHERGKPFVVIDIDESATADACEEHNWLYITGDATRDDTLSQAGVEQATSLASALHSDADNVYVVLSARLLNPDLKIISRASSENAVVKIERAGADKVISPFSTAGVKMARMMLHSGIEDFFEIAGSDSNGLELADVAISDDSPYIGQALCDTNLRNKGVMVLGIRRSNGDQLMPPDSSTVLRAGDSLFAFGSEAAVNSI